MPLVSRTRATLRSAEFGFFGVWVNTRTQTPRFCGLFCSAGLFVFVTTFSRPWRTSWLIVGTFGQLQSNLVAGTPRTPSISLVPYARTSRVEDAQGPVANVCGGDRLVVPGLGSRKTARHPELTYPIRFMVLRFSARCDGAFPPSRPSTHGGRCPSSRSGQESGPR